MTWINFLHLYQPANIEPYAIEEATEASYKRVVSLLEKEPELNFTLNIAGCLILRWKELGYTDLIERISSLARNGQIELTGSVAYHCLAPLVPAEEVKKQIKENTRILKDNLGSDITLNGFFLPEMAYSEEVARSIKEEGFSWIIVDEIAYNKRLGVVDNSLVYQDENSGLSVVFRSRGASNAYVPEVVQKELKSSSETDVLVTATDGELYGFRHEDPTRKLEKLASRKDLKTLTVGGFLSEAESGGEIGLYPCNWESSPEELDAGFPYASWYRDDNELQKRIWELAYVAHDTIENYPTDDNYSWARWHLVRGLASCTFWWASAQDFSYIYGPYAWNPDEVEKGVNELIRAVRSLEDPATRGFKIEAESLYVAIKENLWRSHWENYWKYADSDN